MIWAIWAPPIYSIETPMLRPSYILRSLKHQKAKNIIKWAGSCWCSDVRTPNKIINVRMVLDPSHLQIWNPRFWACKSITSIYSWFNLVEICGYIYIYIQYTVYICGMLPQYTYIYIYIYSYIYISVYVQDILYIYISQWWYCSYIYIHTKYTQQWWHDHLLVWIRIKPRYLRSKKLFQGARAGEHRFEGGELVHGHTEGLVCGIKHLGR